MKALRIQEPGDVKVQEAQIPALRPGYMRVKAVSFALNPTDCDHAGFLGKRGAIIEEIGPDCRTDIVVGDAIFGSVHGANISEPEDGAFAEYVMQKSGLCAKKPENITFEQAASLGVCLTANFQALCETIGLTIPITRVDQPFPILIYGGSTCQGTLAIQYAKLAGLTVVATASPHNFELVKSRGADDVFDYHDSSCAKLIREFTKNQLHHIYDTIGTTETAAICAEALAPPSEPCNGDMYYVSALPVHPFPREDVVTRANLAYTAFGETFKKCGTTIPADEEKYRTASKFWSYTAGLVRDGKLQPHPVDLQPGGLGGIAEGIKLMNDKKVSGRKLLYRFEDTAVHGVVETSSGTERVELQSAWREDLARG